MAQAIAGELPAQRPQPLDRSSIADIQRVRVAEGGMPCLRGATLGRWLDADALRPRRHRSGLFPRDPAFLAQAGVVLALSQGRWAGQPLGPREDVVSADEKTALQARGRGPPPAPPGPGQPHRVEHADERAGALASLAGWDGFGAHLIGQPVLKTGIDPFKTWVDKGMTQAPYRDAERVFWIVDNGSAHHPATFPARLEGWYRTAVAMPLPIHARWLNQIAIVFSHIQRKVLTPHDFPHREAVAARLTAFEARLNANPKPIGWKFTRAKLLEKGGHKHDADL